MSNLIRHYNINGTNVTIVGKQVEDKFQIGVSRCGSKDSFQKKKGTMIALSRVSKHPLKKDYGCTPKNFSDVSLIVAKEVAANPSLINGREYKQQKTIKY